MLETYKQKIKGLINSGKVTNISSLKNVIEG